MLKRFIGLSLSVAMLTLCISTMDVSAYTTLTTYSNATFQETVFSGFSRATGGNNNVIIATIPDGTSFTGASGVSGMSVTDSGFVTNNTNGNKYLQIDMDSSATGGNLQIALPHAMKEDFTIEFKLAMKFDGPDDGVTEYWPDGHPTLQINTNNVNGTYSDSMFMAMYGRGVYGAKNTNAYTGWNRPAVSAAKLNSYTAAATQFNFETIRIVTDFIDNVVPTYSVYRKSYGAGSFTPIFTGGSYSTKNSAGTALTAQDYATTGITNITFSPLNKNTWSYYTFNSNDKLHIAIDDFNVYTEQVTPAPAFNGTFDFEAAMYSEFNRNYDNSVSSAVSASYADGTSITSSKGVARVNITDSGFVANNTTGNKYMEVYYEGNDYASNPAALSFTLPTAFKNDFTMEFKFATDANYPAEGTTIGSKTFWHNGSTFIVDAKPDFAKGTTWDEIANNSRTFFLLGSNTYAKPSVSSGATVYSAGSSLGYNYRSDKNFETIKIVTKFHTDSIPTFDVYRKTYERNYYELMAKDVSYSSKSYKGSELTVSDYNTNGIKNFNMTFLADTNYKALTSDQWMKIAIDDVKLYSYSGDNLVFNDFKIIDGNNNVISAGDSLVGKTLYPYVSITNSYAVDKTTAIIIALFDASGTLTKLNFIERPLMSGSTTVIDSTSGCSVGGAQTGEYVQLFAIDNMQNIRSLIRNFTSKN